MSKLVKGQQTLVFHPTFGQAVRAFLLRAVALVFYLGSVLAINAVQVLSLVLLPFSRRLFRAVNRSLAEAWWESCVIGAERVCGVQPVISGDVLPENENALVFANHQQMADILAIMMVASRKGRLGDMKWFVKDALKYVPGIGWGMQFLDCLFVKRDWLSDKHRIRATFEKFLQNKIPIWLITFVEGTRITSKKLQNSQMHCGRKGLPVLNHVMIPKTRGFTAALEGLQGHLDAVYDITIAFDGGIPKLGQIYGGYVRRIFIDVRRFPLTSLPSSEPDQAQWLKDRFVRKDRILAAYFETGCFPCD